jgi:hypothetical protein
LEDIQGEILRDIKNIHHKKISVKMVFLNSSSIDFSVAKDDILTIKRPNYISGVV